MTKVLIATDKPFAPVAVQGIREIVEAQGYQLVLLEKYTSQAELVAAVADADAMIIRSDKATCEVIEAAKKLKVIVRAGAGYDNIDLAACTARDVVAMNTPGQNANAVAELALGLMVYMARGFYNGKSGSELKGKKIGVHAYGNVGQNVGRIARGFGMEVYAFDPYMTDEQIRLAGATPLHSAAELYSTCQYVSLHIPATAETKKSINRDLLGQMPPNAVLVNTARKEVIDEEGLARLMEERQDFGYITDIAPDSEAFARFEGRFYATPKKMGAQTEEANVNAGLAAARQIVNFLEKGDKRFKVN
ncbi:MAG: 3-phosphoglycerate dehydrogenase [Odoribacteraceae bacterium]|jgi:D-3-phosphoglycerate dehydrogenase|nr:3-phosphoglycerate dehydrogenase [Odoribacteraceae bacterium]